jgi:hypothetical protein
MRDKVGAVFFVFVVCGQIPHRRQKRYLEANGHPASQEITHRLRNTEVMYRANKTSFCSLRWAAGKQLSLLQNHLQDVCWYDHSCA